MLQVRVLPVRLFQMRPLACMVESFPKDSLRPGWRPLVKVTIEIEGGDLSRLLEAAYDRNETVGGVAKQLLHAALCGLPSMPKPRKPSVGKKSRKERGPAKGELKLGRRKKGPRRQREEFL